VDQFRAQLAFAIGFAFDSLSELNDSTSAQRTLTKPFFNPHHAVSKPLTALISNSPRAAANFS
jgi:hypothetical protein